MQLNMEYYCYYSFLAIKPLHGLVFMVRAIFASLDNKTLSKPGWHRYNRSE